jgi:hypothetical protein
MRKVPVTLSELVETWAMANEESSYYLNLETGELDYYWPDGDMEDFDIEEHQNNPDWIELPRDDSRTGYQDMEAFIEKVEDNHLAELLRLAITGRGAFQRFKDVLLNYPEARESWFSFQKSQLTERVKAWLKENNLDVE